MKRYSCWNFGLLEIRFGEGECSAVGENNLKGAGGPDALQTSSPVRSLSRVDTYPHAALRALLVGLRPPTPQSPERLRSTPFDCVAIAPCCFAERKAVLSHALAALTALRFPCAVQAVEICFAALTALNKNAVKAVEICFAALTALNKNAVQAVEICFAALTALNKSAVQAVEICFAALDAYPGGSQGKKMVRSRGLEPRTQ